MTPVLGDRVRKYYAALIIAGVLGAQFWVIIPLQYQQAWYWPFVNYPMYSTAHYAGEQFSERELWAGPAGEPERMRLVSNRELNLTPFKYARALRKATNRDDSMVLGGDESASEFLGRLVVERMPSQPVRLQIWEHTWTIGEGGLEDRAGVRQLKREWTAGCEPGPDSPCSGEIP